MSIHDGSLFLNFFRPVPFERRAFPSKQENADDDDDNNNNNGDAFRHDVICLHMQCQTNAT